MSYLYISNLASKLLDLRQAYSERLIAEQHDFLLQNSIPIQPDHLHLHIQFILGQVTLVNCLHPAQVITQGVFCLFSGYVYSNVVIEHL